MATLKQSELSMSNGAKIKFDKDSNTEVYWYIHQPELDGSFKMPIDCILGFNWYLPYLLISLEGIFVFSIATSTGIVASSSGLSGSYDSTNKILTLTKTGGFATNQTVVVIGAGVRVS